MIHATGDQRQSKSNSVNMKQSTTCADAAFHKKKCFGKKQPVIETKLDESVSAVGQIHRDKKRAFDTRLHFRYVDKLASKSPGTGTKFVSK